MTLRDGLLSRRDALAAGSAAAAFALAGPVSARIPGPRVIGRPNILLIVADQHRFDWLGRNPDIPVPTPHLERLAARGVDFTRVVAPSPSGPARACLASGMEHEHCTVPRNRGAYDATRRPTFYGYLREGGYHTMACGKLGLDTGPESRSPGERHGEAWGFSDMLVTGSKHAAPRDPYGAWLDSVDPRLRKRHNKDLKRRSRRRYRRWWGRTAPTPLDDDAYKDNFTGRSGLELLAAAPEDRPWFLTVNFNGPHPPMDITRNMERMYRGPDRVIEDFPQPHDYLGLARGGKSRAPKSPFKPKRHVRIRQNYAATIENIDRWVGLYQERLDRRGELDDTIVIYTSDHGEMLGDHGYWGKGVPYEGASRVPLVMAGPGIAGGVRSDALVSLMDLAATSLDYAGVAAPAGMQSRSLRPLLDSGGGDHRHYVRSALETGRAASGSFRVVRDRRYKLIEGFGSAAELYDLEADPWEDQNIADRKPRVRARLERRLA